MRALTNSSASAESAAVGNGGPHILEGRRGLTSANVLRRHGVAAATMHKTLGVLDDKGIIREDEAEASPRYKLEDPFFGAWLRHVQESGHA